MPKFVTIGYGDEAGYQRTAPGIRESLTNTTKSLCEPGR